MADVIRADEQEQAADGADDENEEKDAQEQAADEAKIEDQRRRGRGHLNRDGGPHRRQGKRRLRPGGGSDQAPLPGALQGPVDPPGKDNPDDE